MDCKRIDNLSLGIINLSQIDSTNSFLRREAESLFSSYACSDIFVAVAEEQSEGRGQRGAVWCSAKGENLLFSMLVRPPQLLVSEFYMLSVVAAVSLRTAMLCYGIDSVIKWPNDIYCNGKKLAGILLETDMEASYVSQAVVGVGLNVNQQIFPSMSRQPVSMATICGSVFDCNDVLMAFLKEFSRHYAMLLAGESDVLFDMYKQSLMGYGVSMLYTDSHGEFEAVVCDVMRDGRILLRRNDGTISSYSFKEVAIASLGY